MWRGGSYVRGCVGIICRGMLSFWGKIFDGYLNNWMLGKNIFISGDKHLHKESQNFHITSSHISIYALIFMW